MFVYVYLSLNSVCTTNGYPHDTVLKFDHVISHIPAVPAAITDVRDVTVRKGLRQWADISMLFEFSFKISIYEPSLKHSHFGGNWKTAPVMKDYGG